jgi:hypothetical protein
MPVKWNLPHKIRPALAFVIPSDVAVFVAFSSKACRIHDTVSSFLGPLKPFVVAA